jgi:CBS domain-containing protein
MVSVTDFSALAVGGTLPLHEEEEHAMHVETILQAKGRSVVTVAADATIAAAVDALNANRIGAVVVLDNGEIVGMLSERDIVRRLGSDWSALASRTVRDVMTHPVITAAPAESIDDVMERMTEKRIRHMPVVDGSELVGIVSIGDVVKRKIEVTEFEATVLKEYIAS